MADATRCAVPADAAGGAVIPRTDEEVGITWPTPLPPSMYAAVLMHPRPEDVGVPRRTTAVHGAQVTLHRACNGDARAPRERAGEMCLYARSPATSTC